jgi:NhaP-type Na+/H+ or K+/H+ antiporter
MEWSLTIVALAVLAVAARSGLLTGTPVTAAMAFTAVGLVVGPLVADEITLAPTSVTVRTLAEATLAVVLFSDASRIKLRALRLEFAVPVRLLGIGLPLTIALGAVFAAIVFSQVTLAEAFVLAIVLAPTDAALGQAVVTEPRLPSRIRQGLNVESGLNDGICVPLLLIALAAADVQSSGAASHHAVTIVVEEIGYGILGGVGAGLLAALVVAVGWPRTLITPTWLQVIPVAGAALAYGFASALGGSGFISAFVAGGLFGGLVPAESDTASRLAEEVGGLLGGVTLLVFGAVLLGAALDHLSWALAGYAVLSLTVIRILPVGVAMLGSGARASTVGFLGWFGPRGLASIVFAVIAVQEANLPHASTILHAAYITVGLSVFAHGASAAPLARGYARWYESHPREAPPARESVAVPAHRLRWVRHSAGSPPESGDADEPTRA